jgi:NAD(P)H-flavin reductase/truncated hemoglobin YjbI/ferredoxin
MSKITYKGISYTVKPDESALDALVRGGADVNFSCKKGSCQTCMLRVVEGQAPARAQRGLRPELADSGHFLPCVCHPEAPLIVEPPDVTHLLTHAIVTQLQRLGERVLRISLEPERTLNAKPGQYFELHRDDGLARPYSLRGVLDEDYFIEVDVQLDPSGQMSRWLHEQLSEGDTLKLRGPLGDCHLRPEDADRPLLLIGAGTGIAPLHGIVRDALRSHHRAPISLYYGARCAQDLYAHDELTPLIARGVRYVPVVLDGPAPEGAQLGHLVEVAFRDHPDVRDAIVFLCGDPNLVQHARSEAILAGARRDDLRADPFERSAPMPPRDQQIISQIKADPELWEALKHGEKLRAILEDFYTDVYQDPRLAPFFHNVTKQRAIDKQYEFLADMFSGTRTYFGLKPFNAHHWMIISDELFDYREALFERHLRAHALDEHLIRRWSRLHELFRREIVKARPRGLVIDGVEHLHEGFQVETLLIATICDGCQAEIAEGAQARLHRRTGQLYCDACEGTSP